MAKDRAFILVLVLFLSAAMVTVAVNGQLAVRLELDRSGVLADTTQASALARVGLAAALEVLRRDRNGIDSLLDPWSQPLALPLEREDWSVLAVIRDEERGLNLHNQILWGNPPANPAWTPAMERLWKEELGYPQEGLDRLGDWLDPDKAVPRPQGKEQLEYGTGPGAPQVPNGPIRDIRDLLAMPGFTEEMYTGTKPLPGLKECLTVWGDQGGQRVNVNTAPLPVLNAFLGESEGEEVARRRREEPFSNTQELADFLRVEPSQVAEAGFRSTYFRVLATAEVQGLGYHLEALVHRLPGTGDVQVLWVTEGF